MSSHTPSTNGKIILKKLPNGLYGTDMISFLKPLKQQMDTKLNGVDQIMFQLFSMQIKDGFAKDEVETLNEWMTEKLKTEVIIG